AAEGVPDVTSLTFDAGNWDVAQAVTVTGQDDHIVHGDQAYSVSERTCVAEGNYANQTASDSMTKQERDVAELAVRPTAGLVTDEAGGTAQFSVALTSIPAAPVTVAVQTSNAAEGVPDVTSLTFDAGNWSTPQTVTVTGQDDHIVHGDQAYSI